MVTQSKVDSAIGLNLRPVKLRRFLECVFLGWVLAAGSSLSSLALPFLGEIYDAEHLTSVSTRGVFFSGGEIAPTNYYRTLTSTAPFSDALYHPISGLVEAEANAGLFGVSTFTAAANGLHDPFRKGSHAIAQSEVWFLSHADQNSTLRIDFSLSGQWQYSGGYVTLVDVLGGAEILNFNWNGNEGNIPWLWTGMADPVKTALIEVETSLLASREYRLTLHAWTDSNPPDSQRAAIQLSGLQTFTSIPEPTVATVATIGMIGFLWARRRR